MSCGDVNIRAGTQQSVNAVGIVAQASGMERSVTVEVAVVEIDGALARQNRDHLLGSVRRVMENRAAVVIEMIEFRIADQNFHHFNVLRTNGELERRHVFDVVWIVDQLRHLRHRQILDEIEVRHEMRERPRRILRKNVANLLEPRDVAHLLHHLHEVGDAVREGFELCRGLFLCVRAIQAKRS